MKSLITFIIGLIFLALCASCSSKSGRLAEEREMAIIEARLDSEEEATTKLEIERGYDAIIVENSTGKYQPVNDSTVLRVEDNVFFHKRKAPVGMKNTSIWRYYRVY